MMYFTMWLTMPKLEVCMPFARKIIGKYRLPISDESEYTTS